MIQVDTGVVAILVTILLSLLVLAVAWGAINERVKHLKEDTTTYRAENREDHLKILASIENIRVSFCGRENKE